MTKAQCDPNVANNSGQTPLHHAEYLVLSFLLHRECYTDNTLYDVPTLIRFECDV